MNVLSKLYSIINKFNNFIELKRNCGRVNVGGRTKFHQAVSLWCDGEINIAKDANLDLIMVGGLRLECANCKREQKIL